MTLGALGVGLAVSMHVLFEYFFLTLVGHDFGGFGFGGERVRKPTHTPNINHVIKISLEEAYSGVIKTLEFSKKVICSSCDGVGYYYLTHSLFIALLPYCLIYYLLLPLFTNFIFDSLWCFRLVFCLMILGLLIRVQ